MDKIKLPLVANILLVVLLAACNGAETASESPNSTSTNEQTTTELSDDVNQNDAQSEVRKNQLDADIRAREQRNDLSGNSEQRSEDNLASEVRSKLEANIPEAALTVTANNTEVTVSGVVKNQEQLDKIQPLAMEILGVESVVVKAIVKP